MLYLPNADTNDNIEVLNINDSHKLYSIPDGKRVIMEFNGMSQPVGKSGANGGGRRARWSGAVRLSGYRMIGRRYR
jgi:hypothetical protein